MSKSIWYVPNLNLFKQLPTEELTTVEACFFNRNYGNHETIMQPDDEPKVYIVKTGKVELYNITSEGKKIIVDRLLPGSIFGHWGDETPVSYYAESVSNGTKVCSLNREEFYQLIADRPQIAGKLITHLLGRLDEKNRRISYLAGETAMSKLVNLFIQLAQRYGKTQSDQSIILAQKFTHEQLSQMLGISRQTVTTMVNQLETKGYLTRQNKFYQFDIDKISQLA